MSATADVHDAQVLAIIESLREYFGVHRHDRRPAAELAEEWRRCQLFPPTAAQLQRALALMGKTVRGTTRV